MSPSCDRCKYIDAVIVDDAEPVNICRRYPPTAGDWSEVFGDDWCGEFEPTEQISRKQC